MLMVIAGKGYEDHEDQGHDGETEDSEYGESQQKSMQVFLSERADVVLKGRDAHPLFLTELRTVCTLSRHASHKDGRSREHKSDHSVQQAEHGIVARRVFVNSKSLVVYLSLFHGAQGDKITQGADTKGNKINEVTDFDCQEDKSPDDLPVCYVAKTEDEERQLRHDIAVLKSL